MKYLPESQNDIKCVCRNSLITKIQIFCQELCAIQAHHDLTDSLMEVCKSEAALGSFPWSFSPSKRLYPAGHAFFEDGDIFCSVLLKQIFIPENEPDISEYSEDVVCDLVGCHKKFPNLASYDAHYNSFHRNICLECRRSFPSNFLLDLHILENHDVLFKLMSNAKYTHRCLVESCPDKFANDAERKEHLVTVHKYPANFRFNRRSRKQRKLAKDTSEDMEITSNNMNTCIQPKVEVNDAFTGNESLSDSIKVAHEHLFEKRRIPRDICFGRGSMVAFQRKGQNRKGFK